MVYFVLSRTGLFYFYLMYGLWSGGGPTQGGIGHESLPHGTRALPFHPTSHEALLRSQPTT
jgi:hypothetical protein